jgi:hypothetical protein
MINIGAGMIMLSRKAAETVLKYYRTTTFGEVRTAFNWLTGKDISAVWELKRPESESVESNVFFETGYASTDWFYDTALLLSGFVSLATIPSMAKNIDIDLFTHMGIREVQHGDERSGLPLESFGTFVRNHQSLVNRSIEHYAEVCHHPYRNRFVYFPHQVLWSGSGKLTGAQKYRWEQNYGPFNIELQTAGSTLILPVHGGVFDLSFHAGPDCGSCRIRCASGTIDLDLRADEKKIQVVTLDIPHLGETQIEITALAPKVIWRSIASNSPQPALVGQIR